MTKKRFTIEKDVGLYRIFDNGKLIPILDGQPICDLLNKLNDENEQLKQSNKGLQSELQIFKEDIKHSNIIINKLNDENEQLKSTIAQLIEQNRKNNDLLLSDIRILEKALWCSGCENDYGRLRELRKEFIR